MAGPKSSTCTEPDAHRSIRSCCTTTMESCVTRLPFFSSTHLCAYAFGASLWFASGSGAGAEFSGVALSGAGTWAALPRSFAGPGTSTGRVGGGEGDTGAPRARGLSLEGVVAPRELEFELDSEPS